MDRITKELLVDTREAVENYFEKLFKGFNFQHEEIKEMIDDEIDKSVDEIQDFVLEKVHMVEHKAEELTAPTISQDDELNLADEFNYECRF